MYSVLGAVVFGVGCVIGFVASAFCLFFAVTLYERGRRKRLNLANMPLWRDALFALFAAALISVLLLVANAAP